MAVSFTPSQRISVEALNEIGSLLKIESESAQKIEHKCFKAIYQLCKEQQWGITQGREDQICQLRNKHGRSLLEESVYQKDTNLTEGMITKVFFLAGGLKFASDELKADKEIILMAVAKNGY